MAEEGKAEIEVDGVIGDLEIRGVDYKPPSTSDMMANARSAWQWEKDDADLAVLKRMGTDKEILSWHGSEPYLVNTEADEAAAQERLREKRVSMRLRLLSKKWDAAGRTQLAVDRRKDEFTRRQAEIKAQEMEEKRNERAMRLETQAREAEIRYMRQQRSEPDPVVRERSSVCPPRSLRERRARACCRPHSALYDGVRSAANTLPWPSPSGSSPPGLHMHFVPRLGSVASPIASPESPA
jgi:hypothetical protein